MNNGWMNEQKKKENVGINENEWMGNLNAS